MDPLPFDQVDYSGKYNDHRNSPVEVEVWAGERHQGYMRRVGITPPGYPDYATYGKSPFTLGDPTYVLDKGFFWPSQEWRLFYQEHGQTPGQRLTSDDSA